MTSFGEADPEAAGLADDDAPDVAEPEAGGDRAGSHDRILQRRLTVLEETVEQLATELREAERVSEGHRIEAVVRRAEVAELELEVDRARGEAEAHAESAGVVSEVSEKLVDRWRGEVGGLRLSLDRTRSSEERLRAEVGGLGRLVERLSVERDELRDYLDEIEGSRAWRAVTAYRTLRLLLPRRR